MKRNKFNTPKRKRLLTLTFFGSVLLLSAIQLYTAKNYTDKNYPYFAGNYAVNISNPVETLTVVSYNIWFGEDIDRALSELKEIQSHRNLDILLLQEMDETGCEQIAQELQMNYVYFPAAIEPTYGKNFGNAILSRWPILEPQKLILPHRSFSNRMNRIATRATIQIHDNEIFVYSIHTESVFTLPRFREDQYRAVLHDIGSEAELVIVGGDFNSFSEADVKQLEADYGQAGFIRASKDSGYTFVKSGIEMSADHIFVKGFAVKETGKMSGATASDHLPVWVTLVPQ